MGRSAGAGSPVSFGCHACRSTVRGAGIHRVELTGRERPSRRRSTYSMKGARSTDTEREYRCVCGHVGWSNHVDLAIRSGLTYNEAMYGRRRPQDDT